MVKRLILCSLSALCKKKLILIFLKVEDYGIQTVWYKEIRIKLESKMIIVQHSWCWLPCKG